MAKRENLFLVKIIIILFVILISQSVFTNQVYSSNFIDDRNTPQSIKKSYSFASVDWLATTNMSIPDAGFSHEYHGNIYFIGSKSVQVFNTTTEQWTVKLQGGLGYQAYRGSTTLIKDCIYYLSRDQFVYYNITSNKFNNLSTGNQIYLDSAVASIGDVIFVSGGWNSINGSISSKDDFKAYFITNNTWKNLQPMIVPRKEHVMVANDGFIYAIGGLNSSDWITKTNTVERYNPITKSWSLLKNLPIGMTSLAGTATDDGRIVVSTLRNTFIYNISQNFWIKGPLFSRLYLNFFNPSIAYFNGSIFLFGGRDGPGKYYSFAFKVKIGTNLFIDLISSSLDYSSWLFIISPLLVLIIAKKKRKIK